MSLKTVDEEDLELLRKIEVGDQHAEEILVKKYFEPIGVFIRHHLNTNAKAEAHDLRQDLFLEILRSARTGKIKIEEATFSTYLYCAARYKVYHYQKTLKGTISIETDDPVKQTVIDRTIYEYLISLQREEPALDAEELQKIMARLKPGYRSILHKRFFEDMSYEEIGQILNKSAVTVRKAVQRAKESFHVEAKKFLGLVVTILLGRILMFGVESMMESV